MTLTVQAVYEHGVLRPLEPLPLAEGTNVAVTVVENDQVASQPRPPTPDEEDYARRMKQAKSLEEMYAVMATAPPLPAGYDLIEALNANRQATGERPLFLESTNGSDS